MRTFALAALAAAALALAVAVPTSAAGQTADRPDPLAEVRREIEAQNRALEDAFNRGDLLAVARFYADDAKLITAGSPPVEGRAAIDQYWTGLRNPKSWKLEVHEVGGNRDEAYQIGRSTLVTTRDGQDRSSVVKFVVIWRRQPDGTLKMYRDFY